MKRMHDLDLLYTSHLKSETEILCFDTCPAKAFTCQERLSLLFPQTLHKPTTIKPNINFQHHQRMGT